MRESPLATEILGFPLHALVETASQRSQSKAFRYHVMPHELPFESIQDTLYGFEVASPALTLFTLSRTLTFNQLVMAMYEMCGRFALYSPSDRLQAELETHGLGTCSDGWTCVRDQIGSPTSLWTRPPLITTSDLEQFAAGLRGIRGSKMFEQAVNCVSGVTASPLEAQLSMLLWMSCDLGGWGYRNFENNYRIVLSNNAKTLIDTDHAEVDMRVLSPDGTKEWMIECQGKVIHDRVGAGTRDSLRATALQTMAHSVTMVTNDQLSDSDKFNALLDLLSAQLNIHWPEKTSKQVFAEDKLRSEIFDDWIKLADEPSATERARRYAENKAKRAPGHFLKRKKCPNGMGKRGKYTNVERKPSGHSREN